MTIEPRLNGQMRAVLSEMKAADMKDAWLTVPELAGRVRICMGRPISETGLSARIRDLRKDKNGGHTVEKRKRGGTGNLWEFRLRIKQRGLFE